ncbi:hypothetical protein OAD33_08880, partial [Alphaproteobacteria bacterium]|nr:hypothetical protein [Alphaproteobacteria bacterium]
MSIQKFSKNNYFFIRVFILLNLLFFFTIKFTIADINNLEKCFLNPNSNFCQDLLESSEVKKEQDNFFNTKKFNQIDNENLCDKALDYLFWPDKKWSSLAYDLKYVKEAKRRGLDCGVRDSQDTFVANKVNSKNYSPLKNYSNDLIISNACSFNGFKYTNYKSDIVSKQYVDEAKRRGLDCGVESNKTVIASKPKAKTYTSTISSAELDASKREADELRKKLASLQSKQKQEQQRINTDNQIPTISAFTKQNGSNATISGRVTDNTEVAEVLIDGEQLSLTNNGTFKTELYIPRNGLNIEIIAYDRKGNKASKLLKIERGNIQQASGPVFDTLNPSGKRVKSNPNALALIIGVADYEKTNANALYADKDAQQFYDYARMKLGIPTSNIKELVNAKAD